LPLLSVEHDPLLWRHDCDTQPASSGGPMLTKFDGKFELAAVNIGSGDDFNIAVPIAGRDELARDDTCAPLR
jgi:V8-like Glu-specific endopeptidase